MKNLVDIVSKLSDVIGQTEESAKEQFNLEHLTHS